MRRSFRFPIYAIIVFLAMDAVLAQFGKRFLDEWRNENIELRTRIPHPVYNHTLAPNMAFTSSFGQLKVPYFTNSLGFRDSAIKNVPLSSAKPRLLLIGDSFTEGLGLVWPDTYAGQIASALDSRGIEVLNAALTSYAPSVYFRKIKYLIDTTGLKFDAVAVFLDISDIQDEARCYRTGPDDNVLDICSPERRLSKRVKRFLNDNSVSYRLYRTIKDSRKERQRRDVGGIIGAVTGWDRARWTVDDALFERFGRIGLSKAVTAMDKLHALLVQHKIPLTLVVYPWPDQILSGDLDSRHVRYWRSWSAKRNVIFIDLFPRFIGIGNREAIIKRYFLPYDFHFNKEGASTVAETFLSSWNPNY